MGTVPAWLLRPIPGAIVLVLVGLAGAVTSALMRSPALVVGVFSGIVLSGILWSQPWNWRKWLRRRREIGRHRR